MTAPARPRKPVRRFILHKLLPPVGWRAYRALGRSWQYDTPNIERLHQLIAGERPVMAKQWRVSKKVLAFAWHAGLPAKAERERSLR
jgi:hypothetical protein